MKRLLFLVLSLLPIIIYAQTVKMQGKCGDTLESEFKNSKETQDIEISMKHRHLMIRRIYSSFLISIEEKEEMLAKLESEDKSDWMDKTRYYC